MSRNWRFARCLSGLRAALAVPLLLAGCVVYDPAPPGAYYPSPAYYPPPPAYQPYYPPPAASFGFYFGDGPRHHRHHRYWR